MNWLIFSYLWITGQKVFYSSLIEIQNSTFIFKSSHIQKFWKLRNHNRSMYSAHSSEKSKDNAKWWFSIISIENLGNFFRKKKLSNFRIGNFLPFNALKDEIKHKILYFKISTIKSVFPVHPFFVQSNWTPKFTNNK